MTEVYIFDFMYVCIHFKIIKFNILKWTLLSHIYILNIKGKQAPGGPCWVGSHCKNLHDLLFFFFVFVYMMYPEHMFSSVRSFFLLLRSSSSNKLFNKNSFPSELYTYFAPLILRRYINLKKKVQLLILRLYTSLPIRR